MLFLISPLSSFSSLLVPSSPSSPFIMIAYYQYTCLLSPALSLTDKISEHKIHTSSGPLTVTLQLVPKMLSPLVSIWGPELFVVSFKLETDEKKLIEKATEALQKYKHDLVIGNLLQTRREEVTFVTEKESSLLRLTEHQKAEKIEIEKLIVDEVVSRHKNFIKY